MTFKACERKPNRHRRQQPRRGARFWCGCDSVRVGRTGKCPNCGHKHRHDRLRKPPPPMFG